MRPVQLSLEGLHSFRERQTIDFSSLCAGGVFGIFGPTGSGKSTILDAMTLALYGSVERAINNTQGVMNQLEDKMSVSFTFELGDKAQTVRYKVERTFKRTGEHSMKTAVCRLVEMTGETKVLADKKNEVDQAVVSLLGLSIDDFTRAVVLPQGKFSEFLQLRGTDRRQMLQRLFHLEQYGDQLIRKIKSKLQEATHENERLLSEQAGLGDTSLEAIKQAEQTYKYWSDKLEKTLKEKEDIDKQWEQLKQLWSWQEDMKAAKEQLAIYNQQTAEIEQYKKVLDESEQAEGLKPFADALLKARTEVKEWKEKKENASEEYSKQTAILHQKKTEWDTFAAKKEVSLTLLDHYEKSVEQAKKIAQEIKRLDIQKRETDAHLESLTKNEAQLKKELEQEEYDLNRYKKVVSDLEEKYNALYVPPQEKHYLLQAKEEKHRLSYMEKRITEYKEEETRKEESLKNIHQELTEARNKERAILDVLPSRFEQVNGWYQKVSELSRWLERESHSIQDQIRQQQELEQKRETEDMALKLSLLLEEDKPCPVCGSLDHPHPTEHGNEAAATTEEISSEEKSRRESWVIKLQEEQFTLKEKQWQLEQTATELTNCLEDHFDVANFGKDIRDTDYPTDNNRDISEHITMLDKEYMKWKKEQEAIHALVSQISREIHQYNQLVEKRRHILYKYEEMNAQLLHATEQRQKVEADFQRSLMDWQEKYTTLQYEYLDEEYKKLQEREERCDEYKTRAEKGKHYTQELQKQCDSKRNAQHSIIVEKKEIETKSKQLQTFLRERHVELKSLLGEDSMEDAVLNIQQQKERWRGEENKRKEALEHIKGTAEQWGKESSIAEHSYKDAEVRYEHAKTQWQHEQEKREQKFNSPEAVFQKILSEYQYEQYKSNIEQYEKERQKWLNLLENVKTKLKGRVVTEEEFAARKEKREELHRSIDDTREKRGSSAEQLRDMKWKRDRFEELEKVRVGWQEKVEQYQQLQNVFRGKNFIEFLAEEQLVQISRMASGRLHALTRGKYALEVDSMGGFVIRDDANGGVRRPISSLSGGETFLTSLALALSLSASIQLKGQYPLEFFFLDEGFGTLDQELLDTVISALEKLQTDSLSVGIISHVPELQERIARKVEVVPAQPGGGGSTISVKK